MKKSIVYFSISNPEDDTLGKGVVLYLQYKFPYTDILGMVGPKIESIGVERITDRTEIKKAMSSQIFCRRLARQTLEKMIARDTKICFIFGMDAFHRRLAEECIGANLACIVVEPMSLDLWSKNDLKWIQDSNIDVWTLFSPGTKNANSDFLPQVFGFPFSNRLHSICVTKRDFGLENYRRIIAINLADSEAPSLLQNKIEDIAAFFAKKHPEFTLVLATDGSRFQNQFPGKTIALCRSGLVLVKGGGDELFSLAEIALVFGQITSLTCSLLNIPHVCISSKDNGTGNRVNILMGSHAIEEFPLKASTEEIAKALVSLANSKSKRQVQLKAFAELSLLVEPPNGQILTQLMSKISGSKKLKSS